jgi:hypothetical protein
MDHFDLAAAGQPDALRAALADRADELRHAAHGHVHGDLSSERVAEHGGHRIVIRTTYEITVDGRPFDVQVVVDNAGHVYYHGLPTEDFASVVDLVKRVIDQFPDDFGADGGHDHGDHDHGDHDHGPGGGR